MFPLSATRYILRRQLANALPKKERVYSARRKSLWSIGEKATNHVAIGIWARFTMIPTSGKKRIKLWKRIVGEEEEDP